MAYIRTLIQPQCMALACGRLASLQLRDLHNRHVGYYCDNHGDNALDQLKLIEDGMLFAGLLEFAPVEAR